MPSIKPRAGLRAYQATRLFYALFHTLKLFGENLSSQSPLVAGSKKPARAFERKSMRRLRTSASGARPRTSPAAAPREGTHNVYVVLLDGCVGKWRRAMAANPKRKPELPCVYVGLSGLPVEERLANHKSGVKAASVVKKFGLRLLPELFAHLNPMPYEVAVKMEGELAEDLRNEGYTVFGGK